jgi:hypothetical protein
MRTRRFLVTKFPSKTRDNPAGAGIVASAQGTTMSLITVTIGGIAAPEQRTMAVACGAHLLHDGFTDLLYVLLPPWQAEFGLGYAEIGLLRALYVGGIAGFQMPAGALATQGRDVSSKLRHGDVFHYLKKAGLVVQQQHKGVGWIHECLAATGAEYVLHLILL